MNYFFNSCFEKWLLFYCSHLKRGNICGFLIGLFVIRRISSCNDIIITITEIFCNFLSTSKPDRFHVVSLQCPHFLISGLARSLECCGEQLMVHRPTAAFWADSVVRLNQNLCPFCLLWCWECEGRGQGNLLCPSFLSTLEHLQW